MTDTQTEESERIRGQSTASTGTVRSRRGVAIVVAGAVAATAAVTVFITRGDSFDGQIADVSAQGVADEPAYVDAATLSRRADGLFATVDIPTPAPGSYAYPTSDLVPPGFEPHPPVASGASGAPEVFTAWLFVFNFPERCSDQRCDADDVGADTAAMGAVFQLDGRIADGDRLELRGGVSNGAEGDNSVRLVRPEMSEVHVAIAPHGRALPDEDGWRQLNEAVGNPDFWWSATFVP